MNGEEGEKAGLEERVFCALQQTPGVGVWVYSPKCLSLTYGEDSPSRLELVVPHPFASSSLGAKREIITRKLGDLGLSISEINFRVDRAFCEDVSLNHVGKPSDKPKDVLTPRNNAPLIYHDGFPATFKFAVSGSNNFIAHQTAMNLFEGSSQPSLFVQGPPHAMILGERGTGKTLIAKAAANAYNSRGGKGVYCNARDFQQAFVGAVLEARRSGDPMKDYARQWREGNALVLDELDATPKAEKTRGKLYELIRGYGDSRILVTSAMSLDEFPDDELTQFLRGFPTFRIGKCDITVAREIAKKILEASLNDGLKPKGVVLEQVADCIAHVSIGNKSYTLPRVVAGYAGTIVGHAKARAVSPTVSLARSALSFEETSPVLTADHIVDQVASEYGVTPKSIQSRGRKRDIAGPRHVATYIVRKLLGTSYEDLGRLVGGRDYTSAMHSCDVVTELLEKPDAPEAKRIAALLGRLSPPAETTSQQTTSSP